MALLEGLLESVQKYAIVNLQIIEIPDMEQVCKFENNGKEKELDDLDLLKINIRRRAVMGRQSNHTSKKVVDDLKFLQSLDAIRIELSKKPPLQGKKVCVFCKNNRETEQVYSSHIVKDSLDHVICPILSQYTCPVCQATGTKAHTIKYCPINDGLGTIEALLQTPRNGTGKIRKDLPIH